MALVFKALLKKTFIVVAVSVFFLACSCSGSDYTTQYFTFPPDSKPHENNWQYMAVIKVSSDKRPITAKSMKTVEIKVHDQNKALYLGDVFRFGSASVRANVSWEIFEEIKVELLEEGNKFAEDSYNRKLVKEGSNHLLEITYRYDPKSEKFMQSSN